MASEILIVDDEPNIVLSLEFLMKKEGYCFRTARDGVAALHALGEKIPDLILLDVMMPGKDGFEVLREVRTRSAWKNIPVLMLTAKGRDVEREKGLSLGADAYVTKPFSTAELVDKVKTLLAAHAG